MSAANVIPLNRAYGRARSRGELVGVLDVGTTKMCCLIGRRRPAGGLEIKGIGYQLAEGLRGGEIVDAEAVEASILAVVSEAEQQAGETLRDVVLGVCAGRPHSQRTTVTIELGSRPISASDLAQALALAREQTHAAGYEMLHALPVEITLDGGQFLKDPRGMVGRELRIVVHVVQVARASLHNLIAVLERCHLDVAGVVASPYAAGLASLSDDELALGALLIDMGGGVTSVARFAEGRLQELHAVPLGGGHVTQDLAFGLSTTRMQAERLKTLYGSVLPRAGDSRQRLEVPGIGDPDDAPSQIVTRARLTEIIRPRIEEIFQLIHACIPPERIRVPARRLVLTGGASQLEGVVELAEDVFNMPARLGRARPSGAIAGTLDLAAASAATGLLVWAGGSEGELNFCSARPVPVIAARLAKFGQWLRENF